MLIIDIKPSQEAWPSTIIIVAMNVEKFQIIIQEAQNRECRFKTALSFN